MDSSQSKIFLLPNKAILPFLILIAGAAISIAIAVIVSDAENRLIQEEFNQQADSVSGLIQTAIDRNLEVLEAIAAFYAHSGEVTREEFHGFVTKLSPRHKDIQALEWVPRVMNTQRAEYELRAHKDGLHGFRFTERDKQGNMVPASIRTEYYPVYFAEPLAGNEAATGFDLASDPTRKEAIQASLAHDSAWATAPVRLVQETGHQYGFLIFQPLYREASIAEHYKNHAKYFIGFALGVFRAGTMMKYALGNQTNGAISIALSDLSSPSDPLLYQHIAASQEASMQHHGLYQVDIPLKMPGRKWALHIESSPYFESLHQAELPWGVLFAGLSITILLSAYLRSLISRNLEQQTHLADLNRSNLTLEHEITERRHAEKALRERELQFHTLFDSSPDGIVIISSFQTLLMCNPCAIKMLGYELPEELLGRNVANFVAPKDQERAAADIQLVANKGIVKSEYTFIKKDGSELPVEVSGAMLNSPNGTPSGVVGIIRDISERKRAEATIKFMVNHDPLTQLPNYLLIKDRFNQEIAHASREHKRVALLFLDVDHFKVINDSLGHPVGDSLLKQVALRLRECIRESDSLGRQGGDEFIIMLTDLPDAHHISNISSKIITHLSESFVLNDERLSITASIGVSVYPDDGMNFDTLFKKADTAMYHAKEAGRNTCHFINQRMNDDADERLRIRNGLQRGLEKNEFVVRYQPQIDLGTGAITGAEALIRWNSPELGLVEPARFISIAEESGLIVPIGEWILREACQQAALWQRHGHSDFVIAVNLSAVQFRHGDIERIVVSALTDASLNPESLELELTESILIGDTENVLRKIKNLKLLGIKLSIDDFGTGYSSLSYLRRFAVDKVKIDQSFVRDLFADQSSNAIVKTIIQMARNMDLKIIAEGIENQQQLSYLQLHHCDEGQGYFIGMPMSANELSEFLGKSVIK